MSGECNKCGGEHTEQDCKNRQADNSQREVPSYKPRYCGACGSELIDEGDGVVFCSNGICPSNDYSGNFDPY